MMAYWRYVDDSNSALTSIDPGVRLVKGEDNSSQWLEVKPGLVQLDLSRREDERTAEFLSEVANSIHQSIGVKSDFPSKNFDRKMPLLDLKIWVDKEDIIKFSFFSKEMSSKYFIPMSSAHSQSMKKSMLSNEGLRRLLNMSPDLPWEEYVEVMNQYAVKMWRSGYPSSWRLEAVQSALGRYETMLKDEKDGTRPMFRPNSFMENERRLDKLRKAKLWHKKGMEADIVAGAPLIICPFEWKSDLEENEEGTEEI
jgi:hypothetical protein